MVGIRSYIADLTFLSDGSRYVAMAKAMAWPILRSKLTKSDYSLLFVALAFRNVLQYRHSDLKKCIWDDLAHCVNLVNFGPLAPEYKMGRRHSPPYLKIINPMRQIISRSTWLIFTKFLPYGRYLIVDYESDLSFPIVEGTLPWQLILSSKLAKSAYSVLFVTLAFGNELQYRTSDFKKIDLWWSGYIV